jgi:hypothetical protein
LLAHADAATLVVIVCEAASSASSARSGPIRTCSAAAGLFASEKRAIPVPSAFSLTDSARRGPPSHGLTTTLSACPLSSSAEIADASTGTSSV